MDKHQRDSLYSSFLRCLVVVLTVSLCLTFAPTSWAEELTEDTETPAVEVTDASDEDQDPSQNAEESADEGTAEQPEDEAVSQDGTEKDEETTDTTTPEVEVEDLTASADVDLTEAADLGGVYEIISVSSGKAIDIKSGKYTVVGTLVQQYTANSTIAQRWYLKKSGSHYLITNGNSGLVLDMGGKNTKSGTQVKMAKETGADSQLWDVYVNNSGAYEIISVANKMALDVKGASSANGAAIQVYSANHTAAQQWKLEQKTAAIEDGTYAICSAIDGSMVLDVSGGSKANGGKVQVYTSNDTMAQRWQLTRDEKTGYYTITSANSSKCIDIPAGKANQGVLLQQYTHNGTAAQMWNIEKNQDDSLTVTSAVGGLTLGIANGAAKNGSRAQLQNSSGAASQHWYFEHENLIEDGLYVISPSSDSSKVLDVSAASLSQTAKIQLYSKNDTLAQKWVIAVYDNMTVTIQNANSGLYLGDSNGTLKGFTRVSTETVWDLDISLSEVGGLEFVNSKTGRVLDVAGGKMASGTKVQTYTGNDSNAQAWTVSEADPIADGDYAFVNCGTTKAQMVMDVKSGSTAAGAAIQLYTSNDTNAQKWNVKKNSNGYYTITCFGSNMVLDVPSGKAAEGKAIQQYTSNNSSAQQWEISVAPTGGLRIKSRLGKYVLGTKDGGTSNSTPVVLRAPAANATQAWRVKTVVANVPASGVNVSAAYQRQMIERANAAKSKRFDSQGWSKLSSAQQAEAKRKGSATDWYITVEKGSPNVLNTQVCVLHYNSNGWQVVRSYKARTASNTFTGLFIGYYKRKAWWLPVEKNMGVNPWWFCYRDASEDVTGQGFHGGYHSGGCVVIEGINGGASFPDSKWIYDNVPIGTTIDLF